MTDRSPPPAASCVNAEGTSPYVLLCEHASNFIPKSYGGLGLPEAELQRHIAWDIGALALARLLSDGLDAPLFLSGYSRLLIDCNRPLGTLTSIPERSEDTVIPGNAGLDPAERARRAAAYFEPLRTLVAAELDRREAQAMPTILVGVHSFTPVFQGIRRPWHGGILYSASVGFARALITRLASDPNLVVGDNEPYQIEPEHDYTVPIHGDRRRIPAALLEVRQDLLTDHDDVCGWAERLTAALSSVACLALPPCSGASPGARKRPAYDDTPTG